MAERLAIQLALRLRLAMDAGRCDFLREGTRWTGDLGDDLRELLIRQWYGNGMAWAAWAAQRGSL